MQIFHCGGIYMIKQRSLIFLTLALILLTGGCGNTKTNNGTQQPAPGKKTVQSQPLVPGDYFPLKAGSTWTYQGAGNEYASFERQVEYVKNNFAQIREANGGTISSSVYQTSSSAVTRVYTKGESYDNKNILDGGFSSNDNTVIIQSPLKNGGNWQNDDNIRREIVSRSAALNTPAGSFKNCLHIKMAGAGYVINEYYAPGVGLVKREFISNGETISSTLQSYRIGPEAGK